MGRTSDESLEALELELRLLEKLPLGELRNFWSERWGFAPRLRSVGMLRHMIAWRLQEELLGGLDASTRTLLRQTSIPRPGRPPVGSRITREYRGVLHQVEVAEKAFVYRGRPYRSLSEIAREITGARWNGPRFFGLRTVNVLLSFAQFERELSGERIRDKIAASKKRGMWMGGVPPLGYDLPTDPTTRALVVNCAEDEQVRMIFETYLRLGSVGAVEAYLSAAGVRSKAWVNRDGQPKGGKLLARGALYHLLRNRLYLGEIVHGDNVYAGAHPRIVEPELFSEVQSLLNEQRRVRRERPTRAATMPLKGIIFDAAGSPMCPSFTHCRHGKLHRYYVSAPLQQGRSAPKDPDLIRRLAAGEIESLVRDELLRLTNAAADAALETMVGALKRIDVEAREVRLTLARSMLRRSALVELETSDAHPTLAILTVPIRCKLRGGRSWIIAAPEGAHRPRPRIDRALVRALRVAHKSAAGMGWRATDGTLTRIDAKAPTSPYDRKVCRLAYLAPDIQRAILEGRQPLGLTLERLMREPIPAGWVDQRRAFGMP